MPVNLQRVGGAGSDANDVTTSLRIPNGKTLTFETPGDGFADAGRCVFADDFGADPTGVTDSSAAIQAALDSFSERGGTVILGRGTYKCNSTIKLGNSSRLIGQGSGLTDQPTTDPTLVYHPATVLDFSGGAVDAIETDPTATYRCQLCYIADFTIKGSGVTNTKAAVKLSPGLHPVPKVGLFNAFRIHVEFYQVAFALLTSDSTTIIESWATDCTNAATEGASECKWLGGGWWRITGSCWFISNATGALRCVASNLEIEPENAVTALNWTNVTHGKIINNTFRNPATGVLLDDCNSVIVAGNDFVASSRAIRVTGTTTNTTITSNTMVATTGSVSAITVDVDTPDSHRVVITGNSASGSYSDAALVIATGSAVRVKNNGFSSVKLNGGTTTQASDYDLWIEAICANYTDTRTGAGAVSVTARTTHLVTTGTDPLTLASGRTNQRKTITMITAGGTGTLTPTLCTGFSTIAFAAVGDTVTLRWASDALGWMIDYARGAVVV